MPATCLPKPMPHRSELRHPLCPTFVYHSEIVLLDFHRFPDLGHGPPHEKAAMVVVDVLNDVMIDPKHRHQPFGKLLNQKGRVAVLWNANEVCDVFPCSSTYV